MRWTLLLVGALLSDVVLAQAGWMPLSREVEQPYATSLQQFGSDHHTAIRPYRLRDVRALPDVDSLRPAAALGALDRWAGVDGDRKFRWGPLADASVGFDGRGEDPLRHTLGGGFWTDVDVNDKLSFHLDAQAWGQRFAGYLDTLVRATQVTPGLGYAHGTGPDVVHYDINGHVSWDPGKYFNLTMGRGRNFFGEGHRSLMLSSEAYSYPYLRITTTVWKVKYVNLFTRMSDIRDADGVPSRFRGKYTSMHYLSWNVGKRFNLALFEAVVWQQGDSAYPRGFDINYVNPIIFYRPVEFDIGSPDNALLGGAINVKVGRHTLLYSQLMLDELLMSNVRARNGWFGNKQSLQLGVVAREAFGVPGLVLRGEWNYVRPFMYSHSDTRQNYAHHGQALAHPYGSNVNELVAHADRWQGRWHVGLRMSMAWMGADSVDSYGNNIFRPERDRPRNENGALVNFGYRMGDYTPLSLFHGEVRGGLLLDPHTGTRLEFSYMYRQRTLGTEAATMDHFLRLGLVCHFRDRHPEQEVRYVIP
jgi:hypothetical protein